MRSAGTAPATVVDANVAATLAEVRETGAIKEPPDLQKILVEEGVVSADDLAAIVRQQIEDTIFEVLRWDGGHFVFESDVGSDEDVGLSVSVENLVMEGATS